MNSNELITNIRILKYMTADMLMEFFNSSFYMHELHIFLNCVCVFYGSLIW